MRGIARFGAKSNHRRAPNSVDFTEKRQISRESFTALDARVRQRLSVVAA